MTTDLSEDVVLQISSPQILTTSLNNENSNTQASILEYVQTSQAESGAAGRGGAYSGSAELGRRLLLAARHGQTALVLDLMARGAPFTTDWLGTSPLHLAASHAHVETCAVLLRAGVSRDSRTKVERTPLHLAAHAGHAAVAALLLDHGALVDCRDMLRMTPLHWAVQRGHGEVVRELVRRGADPHAASKFQQTPLSLAARRRAPDLLRLLEDALQDREAERSVHALREANEEIMEIPAAEQQQALESIERLQETVKPPIKQQSVHTEPIKIEIERPPESGGGAGAGAGAGGAALAAALLRKHGITLLPHDDTSTVLNAIQSGRTVVLSDAGKLMLKESSDAPAQPPSAAPPPPSKGVILTAAPVKSPPKPGVKIFTLNNKLLAMPKENKVPIKKIINSQDMQIKFVNLPSESALVPAGGGLGGAGKVTKAKARVRSVARPPTAVARPPSAATRPPAVKIIMHKANFNKLRTSDAGIGMELTNSAATHFTTSVTPTSELTKVVQDSTVALAAPQAPTAGLGGGEGAGGGVLCVPAEFLSSTSTHYLRAQLLTAHHTIQELRRELAALQRR